MKAAVVTAAGKAPVYADFREPSAHEGAALIFVRAAALSPFTRARASGSHYSADGVYPLIAGADGVGTTRAGRRVYFALPEAPFGAMAEQTLVDSRRCIDVPPGIDDVTAAALANPGMAAWGALVIRAQLKPGETVLVNGATGTAGRLTVQLAKYLGAAKVIATGRNESELEALKSLGADAVIPFARDLSQAQATKVYEQALNAELAKGIDVVVDYVWGKSAETVIVAIARAVEDAHPVRFVHVGAVAGDDIVLPGAALRSSAIVLMGSGVKSVPMSGLLSAIECVFAAYVPARLSIATRAVSLADVEATWSADPGKSRVVFVVDT